MSFVTLLLLLLRHTFSPIYVQTGGVCPAFVWQQTASAPHCGRFDYPSTISLPLPYAFTSMLSAIQDRDGLCTAIYFHFDILPASRFHKRPTSTPACTFAEPNPLARSAHHQRQSPIARLPSRTTLRHASPRFAAAHIAISGLPINDISDVATVLAVSHFPIYLHISMGGARAREARCDKPWTTQAPLPTYSRRLPARATHLR